MGLMLRYAMFHNTTAPAVYGAYASFYDKRGRPLENSGAESRRLDFYCEENGWVVVGLDGGWEWKERREAQLFVSQRLCCPGFFVFCYDGDYWGYEFFDHGVPLDRFVQEASEQTRWFPGVDCRGDAEVIANRLPVVSSGEIAPYLVQKNGWVRPDGMDTPARAGDEFRRFDELRVTDFLRMLGVALPHGRQVRPRTQMYRSVFLRTSER